jgi:hypothetical protein
MHRSTELSIPAWSCGSGSSYPRTRSDSVGSDRPCTASVTSSPLNIPWAVRVVLSPHGLDTAVDQLRISAAYDWKSLNKGDLVVDVGGGIGSSTLHLAKAFPDLRFIVQDREHTVQAGIKVCVPDVDTCNVYLKHNAMTVL